MEKNTTADININIDKYNGATPIVVEIINREGRANDVQIPVKVLVTGNIYAAQEYIQKNFANKTELEPGIITVSGLNEIGKLPKIEFDTDPAWAEQGAKITASLEWNPDFTDFKLNKAAFMTADAMIEFLRSHAHCFDGIENVRKLIKSLQNQTVIFEHLSENSDDRKGETEKRVKEQLKITKGELPSAFDIMLPVFKGTPPKPFNIEMEIERRGTSPAFAFYCLGVEKDTMDWANILVRQQLDACKTEIFTVIYK